MLFLITKGHYCNKLCISLVGLLNRPLVHVVESAAIAGAIYNTDGSPRGGKMSV